jgi:hypothetical protein
MYFNFSILICKGFLWTGQCKTWWEHLFAIHLYQWTRIEITHQKIADNTTTHSNTVQPKKENKKYRIRDYYIQEQAKYQGYASTNGHDKIINLIKQVYSCFWKNKNT